jgi:hypothetical protein
MLHFPLIHDAYLTGSTSGIVEFYPEWCPFPENHATTSQATTMVVLTLVAMILSPLHTVVFIKSKKKVRLFLLLLPIVLILIIYILVRLYPPSQHYLLC